MCIKKGGYLKCAIFKRLMVSEFLNAKKNGKIYVRYSIKIGNNMKHVQTA